MRETSSSCFVKLSHPISVPNLLLLKGIKKNNLKKKILQGVSLCAVFELFLVNQ